MFATLTSLCSTVTRYDSFSLLTYVHHPTLHLRHTVTSSTSTTATTTIANQTISSVSIFSMPTRVTCRLYDHRSQHLTTVLSLPIIEQTLVRCPVPYDVRDKVLKRHYHGVTDKIKADKYKDNPRGGSGSALRGGPISSSSSLSSENQHQQRLRYEAVNSEIKVRLVWSTASSSTSPTSSTTSKSSLPSSTATSIKSSIGSPATNNRYHQHRRVMLSSATTATTATTTTKLTNIFSRNNNNSMRVKSKNNDKTHPRPSPLYPVCALPHLTTLPERPPSQHRPLSPLLDTGRGEKGTPLPGWSTAFGPDRHGSPSSKYPNSSPPLPPQQEQQQQQPYGIAICSATFRGGGGGGYSSNSNNNSTDSDDVDDYLYRKQVHIST